MLKIKGQFLGMDLDDTAFIPAARAIELFNRSSLNEIDVAVAEGVSSASVAAAIKRMMIGSSWAGEISPSSRKKKCSPVCRAFSMVLNHGWCSRRHLLFVGGVGIATMMTITVSERTSEIGLLVALGARRRTILGLFLSEAVALAALGGFIGLIAGIGLAQLIRLFVPVLPVHTPLVFVLVAEVLAMVIGLLAGVLPARQTMQLNPVDALRGE